MKLEYPLCDCGQAMVWSFALTGCEWVCAPCSKGLPMFNGHPKVQRNKYYMNAKKQRWGQDLSVIARRYGGATCGLCDDGSCDWCKRANDKNYQFEFWGKNIKEPTHA